MKRFAEGCWKQPSAFFLGDDVGEHISRLPNLQTAARLLGGHVNGDNIQCPGPGHSKIDKSLSVKLDPNAPDGILVFSHSGDDPITCLDHVRSKLGLSAFKPNGKERFSESDIERAVLMAASSRSPKPVATYDYTDASGKLLYQVCR